MIHIYIYRSEGDARTGYFIPGCDGMGGLEVAGNPSVVAVAVVAVQVPCPGSLVCVWGFHNFQQSRNLPRSKVNNVKKGKTNTQKNESMKGN